MKKAQGGCGLVLQGDIGFRFHQTLANFKAAIHSSAMQRSRLADDKRMNQDDQTGFQPAPMNVANGGGRHRASPVVSGVEAGA